jgi:uncharacterized membrane protein
MTKKAKAGRLFPAAVVVLILLAVTTVNMLTPLIHADGSPVSLGDIIVADANAPAVFRQSPSVGVAPTTIFSGGLYVEPVGVAIYEFAPVVPPGGGPGLGAGMLIVLIMLIVILSGVGAAAALSRRLSVGAQRPIRL